MNNKKIILIIEDDRKLAGFIREYLEKYEFTVNLVYDGLKGITAISDLTPDLVILDLMLPGTDGLDVCRQVRPGYSGRILMLTAVEDHLDQVAAIEMGVDDYVVKPIELRVLLARVHMLLRRNASSVSKLSDWNNTQTTPIQKSPLGLSTNPERELVFGALTLKKIIVQQY